MANQSMWQGSRQPEAISFSEREILLHALAGFSALNPDELRHLIGLMEEVTIAAGEVIVVEGDAVDSVYIIARGSAEVTKELDVNGKKAITLLAILNQGDSIGLKEARLLSETGLRTATVTANTTCVLLRLSLQPLYQFLQEHNHILTDMTKSVDLTLRMQLIKDVAPFAQLSNQRVVWLANWVKDVHLKAGDVIFEQGDKADCCYMIAKGQVDIIIADKPSVTLNAGRLFGEAALLVNGARNARAEALTDCHLLMLDSNMLTELMSNEAEAPEMLRSLVSARQQPRRRDGIIYQQRHTADGHILTVLKDTQRNKYLQLTEEGWFIWQQLNGKLTLQEVSEVYHQAFHEKNAIDFMPVFRMLVDAGFIDIDQAFSESHSEAKATNNDRNITSRRAIKHYFIKNADKKIDFLYRHMARFLFTLPSILFFLVMSLGSVYFFVKTVDSAIYCLLTLTQIGFWLLAVISFSMTLMMVSALIKALVIKHFGYDIPHISIAWRIIGPCVYIDTSSLMLSAQKPRIMAIVSSILSHMVLAALLSGMAYYWPNKTGVLFLWLSALCIYLQLLRQLNPLLDLEGYQWLVNALEMPNLREIATQWLIGLKGKSYTRLALFYWIYNVFYLSVVVGFIAWIQQYFILYWPEFLQMKGLIPLIVIGCYVLDVFLTMLKYKKSPSETALL